MTRSSISNLIFLAAIGIFLDGYFVEAVSYSFKRSYGIDNGDASLSSRQVQSQQKPQEENYACDVNERNITTGFINTGGEDTEVQGIMFDVESRLTTKEVKIMEMDLNIEKPKKRTIQVYTKSGSHVRFESDKNGWKDLGTYRVKGKGQNKPTRLTLSEGVFLLPGAAQAFYIRQVDDDDIQTYERRNIFSNTGEDMLSDENLKIKVGTGKNDIDDDDSFDSRDIPGLGFSGTLYYTVCPLVPSSKPSHFPSFLPSDVPSTQPSPSPTFQPSQIPSSTPSFSPTSFPTVYPSAKPSSNPSLSPSDFPSFSPSLVPSANPTEKPTSNPSLSPSDFPSKLPSENPSFVPSVFPSISLSPTVSPSLSPSALPSHKPTRTPSVAPSMGPSKSSSTISTNLAVQVQPVPSKMTLSDMVLFESSMESLMMSDFRLDSSKVVDFRVRVTEQQLVSLNDESNIPKIELRQGARVLAKEVGIQEEEQILYQLLVNVYVTLEYRDFPKEVSMGWKYFDQLLISYIDDNSAVFVKKLKRSKIPSFEHVTYANTWSESEEETKPDMSGKNISAAIGAIVGVSAVTFVFIICAFIKTSNWDKSEKRNRSYQESEDGISTAKEEIMQEEKTQKAKKNIIKGVARNAMDYLDQTTVNSLSVKGKVWIDSLYKHQVFRSSHNTSKTKDRNVPESIYHHNYRTNEKSFTNVVSPQYQGSDGSMNESINSHLKKRDDAEEHLEDTHTNAFTALDAAESQNSFLVNCRDDQQFDGKYYKESEMLGRDDKVNHLSEICKKSSEKQKEYNTRISSAYFTDEIQSFGAVNDKLHTQLPSNCSSEISEDCDEVHKALMISSVHDNSNAYSDMHDNFDMAFSFGEKGNANKCAYHLDTESAEGSAATLRTANATSYGFNNSFPSGLEEMEINFKADEAAGMAYNTHPKQLFSRDRSEQELTASNDVDNEGDGECRTFEEIGSLGNFSEFISSVFSRSVAYTDMAIYSNKATNMEEKVNTSQVFTRPSNMKPSKGNDNPPLVTDAACREVEDRIDPNVNENDNIEDIDTADSKIIRTQKNAVSNYVDSKNNNGFGASEECGSLGGFSELIQDFNESHHIEREIKFQREYIAPPGALGVKLQLIGKEPIIQEVKEHSPFWGLVFPGDKIISIDDFDTAKMTAIAVSKLMVSKIDKTRKITVSSEVACEDDEVSVGV